MLRQELFSRKQDPNEQLSVYTEDIIKKSQRLGLTDKDMMNIFINGLTNEIKTHVILSQPDTFAKAENLARLRDAVMKNSGVSGSVVVAQNLSQEAKIKELEGQVNLLMSLASQKKDFSANPKPVQAMSQFYSDQAQSQESYFQPKTSNSELASMKNEILAAIETKFAAAKISGNVNNAGPPRRGRFTQPGRARGGARGRNLRTTDGQPICNNCRRVGHVARYCRSSQMQPSSANPFAQQPQRPSYENQNLNGTEPSPWGH